MLSSIVLSELCAPQSPFILQNDRFEHLIQKAAVGGFAGVEMQIQDPGKIDWRLIRRVCQEYNITVTSIATGLACREGLSLSAYQDDIRLASVERIRAQIALAEQFDSDTKIQLGLMVGRRSACLNNSLYYLYLIDSLKRLVDEAEKRNITLCIEPVNHFDSDSIHTWEEAAAIIDVIGSGRLGISMDLYHMRLEERDIVQTILKYGSYIGAAQFVDDNRLPPGCGNFRFDSIVDALFHTGYDGAIIFECIPSPDPVAAMDLCQKFYHFYFEGGRKKN